MILGFYGTLSQNITSHGSAVLDLFSFRKPGWLLPKKEILKKIKIEITILFVISSDKIISN